MKTSNHLLHRFHSFYLEFVYKSMIDGLIDCSKYSAIRECQRTRERIQVCIKLWCCYWTVYWLISSIYCFTMCIERVENLSDYGPFPASTLWNLLKQKLLLFFFKFKILDTTFCFLWKRFSSQFLSFLFLLKQILLYSVFHSFLELRIKNQEPWQSYSRTSHFLWKALHYFSCCFLLTRSSHFYWNLFCKFFLRL